MGGHGKVGEWNEREASLIWVLGTFASRRRGTCRDWHYAGKELESSPKFEEAQVASRIIVGRSYRHTYPRKCVRCVTFAYELLDFQDIVDVDNVGLDLAIRCDELAAPHSPQQLV